VEFLRSDDVARVRARIDHPVIDSDGHLIEYLPLVRDFIVEDAGEDLATRFDTMVNGGQHIRRLAPGEERRSRGIARHAWWGLPAENTLDRATAMLPELMVRRLDEFGIDFAVLYPSAGITVTAYQDGEVRQAMARAFNRYYAEVYGPYRDRLEPVACIPMFTPDEALAELDHAVNELGLKAVMLAGVIPRVGGDGSLGGRWLDTLAHDSIYDYDPVWAACERLGVAATFHAAGVGWGSRTSTTNYVYNHIGNFAAAGEAAARALFFGGVPARFPNLRFAFQEGGVAWACNLLSDILGHYEKRNRDAIRRYDPDRLDRQLLTDLFAEYATGPVRDTSDRLLTYGINMLSEPEPDAKLLDEFASTGVDSEETIVEIFTRQYHFGCEADDPMNALAFDGRLPRLRAVFASDIGHWDVPDAREVLPEAYELVEHGHLTEDDFAAFVFENPVSLWAGANPNFFTGTTVENAVDKLTASGTSPSS
jgi:predicted TIM-barrel fold metal-dependent hydrolase